jgi:hypothetical protein
MCDRSSRNTPVGLNRIQPSSASSGKAHHPTNSLVSEKRRAMTSGHKGCRNCDWRGFKLSMKLVWNRLNGLASKRS